MKTNSTLKVAVSALALTTTMVACKPAAQTFRPAYASSAAAANEKKAAEAFTKAKQLFGAAKVAPALAKAEEAVGFAPNDVGYRMLLADLYLKNGRFELAQTTYRDVLRLDPSNKRAGLSVALTEIALGRPAGATAQLDQLEGSLPAADIGLAYALAGKPDRAIGLLETAARAPGANGRVRQNLALSYALAGDWAKARATAAQDVSPAELPARLQQWAALANPGASAEKVASLLGTHPASDPGQPSRLALAAPAPAQQLAAAEPAPEPTPAAAAALAPEVRQPEPLKVAAISAPVPDPAPPAAASLPVEETKPVYAEAVQSLVAPQPFRHAAAVPLRIQALHRFEAPAPRRSFAQALPAHAAGRGKFAVQLGAFSNPAAVERAWAHAYKRYGFANATPLSTTVAMAGRGTFHRLSVAGFENRGQADRICASVRSHGGVCFVRALAGDAPVRWASRYSSIRHG